MLAIEEPLEISLAYDHSDAEDQTQAVHHPAAAPPPTTQVRNLAVTMRTPGHDADLALGFLFTEGIIAGLPDVKSIEHIFAACSENKENSILVALNARVVPNLGQAERNFYTTSSCGVCGKASINAIRTVSPHSLDNSAATNPADTKQGIDPDLILSLPDRLSNHQQVFAATGGLHAAALFNGAAELLLVREDVGGTTPSTNSSAQRSRVRISKGFSPYIRCREQSFYSAAGPVLSWCKKRPWQASR